MVYLGLRRGTEARFYSGKFTLDVEGQAGEGSQTQRAECCKIPRIWISGGSGTIKTENRSGFGEGGEGLTGGAQGLTEGDGLLCILVMMMDI